MKIIKVQTIRHAHYYAQCTACEFTAGIGSDGLEEAQDVRNKIRKHVRKTGHEVILEKGISVRYSAT